MSMTATAFADSLRARFAAADVTVAAPRGEVGIVFAPGAWHDGCRALRDEFGFEMLIDACGADYLGYGSDEWDTGVSSQGFSRGVSGQGAGRFGYGEATTEQLPQPQGVGAIAVPRHRFAVVVQLLSVRHNRRVRATCFAPDDVLPMVDSVTDLWPVADWFEREAFDMYGMLFSDHPDLRRLLTDYGFQGHPLRKDFPMTGYVEVRYDEEQKRVVYEPVKLTQEFRQFDFLSPWEGAEYPLDVLPGDEKAQGLAGSKA